MEGLLSRHAGAPGELGRVDLADDIGELGARGQAFGVALARGHQAMGTFSAGTSAIIRLPGPVIGLVGSSCTGDPGMSR